MTSTGPNIANLLGMARTAELAGNSEEAISYYNRVLETDPGVAEAWLGKGRAAGGLSTLGQPRLTEMVVAQRNAIGCASEEERGEIGEKAVDDLTSLVATLYGMAGRHLAEFQNVPGTVEQHFAIMSNILDALRSARGWGAGDAAVSVWIMTVTKRMLDEGATPAYAAELRAEREAAHARLLEIDPTFSAEPLQSKTAAEERVEASENEAVGWVVAIVIMVILGFVAAAVR